MKEGWEQFEKQLPHERPEEEGDVRPLTPEQEAELRKALETARLREAADRFESRKDVA